MFFKSIYQNIKNKLINLRIYEFNLEKYCARFRSLLGELGKLERPYLLLVEQMLNVDPRLDEIKLAGLDCDNDCVWLCV